MIVSESPPFGTVATAIGIHGQTVDDPAALEVAMKRWLQTDGPAQLSVVTDTDAVSFSFSQQLMQKAKPDNPLSNFTTLGS